MNTPVCSICGATLEYLGGHGALFGRKASVMGADQPALEMWRGTMCNSCSYVFCPECLDVSPPPACPICDKPTLPAMRGYLQSITAKKVPIVDVRKIEASAGSIDEAKHKLRQLIPDGFRMFGGIDILADGTEKLVRGFGETVEIAQAEARRKVPDGAAVVKETVEHSAKRWSERVTSSGEQTAKDVAILRAEEKVVGKKGHVEVKGVTCVTKPKDGVQIFSIRYGRRLGIWDFELLQPAEVSITIEGVSPRVTASIGKLSSKQQDSIGQQSTKDLGEEDIKTTNTITGRRIAYLLILRRDGKPSNDGWYVQQIAKTLVPDVFQSEGVKISARWGVSSVDQIAAIAHARSEFGADILDTSKYDLRTQNYSDADGGGGTIVVASYK
jgi:hypothetical protein